MAPIVPPKPSKTGPPPGWQHRDVYDGVIDALHRLPESFKSPLHISGVLATDLFAFNSSLSTTIEEQVVSALNNLRHVWDEKAKYDLYAFERQPQTFPDVVLRTKAPGQADKIILGLELKGWYALAKEREPSFRYKVTPAVCAEAHLLVIVPWALSEVISGSPRVFEPYITSARYAAEYRNWWWEHEKGSRKSAGVITLSTFAQNYPTKSDAISDRPHSDSGGNFGRFARTGLMNEYIGTLFEQRLAGIPLGAWQSFFALFKEETDLKAVEQKVRRLQGSQTGRSTPDETLARIAGILLELAGKIS